MARTTESRTYTGRSADDFFAAARAALPKAGFEIHKICPIAWLVLANRTTPDGVVKANFAFRPGATGTQTLAGDRVSEAALYVIDQEVIAAIEAEEARGVQ